jgi:hypothetical protein
MGPWRADPAFQRNLLRMHDPRLDTCRSRGEAALRRPVRLGHRARALLLTNDRFRILALSLAGRDLRGRGNRQRTGVERQISLAKGFPRWHNPWRLAVVTRVSKPRRRLSRAAEEGAQTCPMTAWTPYEPASWP